MSDLDRSADLCGDFFAFANGTWRAQNPIPASMVRWSRRWQAGENAKDRLKDILDEVAARRDWPAASVEQLIGDFYGGCMDQARIDQRGVQPIQPLLAEIEQLREPGDLGRMIARLHHNGQLVLGEAIGDLGGVNLAYRAFQKAKQQSPAPVIDGFSCRRSAVVTCPDAPRRVCSASRDGGAMWEVSLRRCRRSP